MIRTLQARPAFIIVTALALAACGLVAGAAWQRQTPRENPGSTLARTPAEPDRAPVRIMSRSAPPAAPAPLPHAAAEQPAATTARPVELAKPAPVPAMRTNGTIDSDLILTHRVSNGETLKRIAARYRVTPEFLATLNRITRLDRISAGTVLKVVQGPFCARVNKATFRLDVYLGDRAYRSFDVGLGLNGSTPTGTWRVKDKLKNPSWSNPKTHERFAADDPANPIGEHWIGLEGLSGDAVGKMGFGIHGTIEPDSIGRNASLGCVRLRAPDIAALYGLLVEGASAVEIH